MKRLALILALAIAAQGALVTIADAGPRGGGGGGRPASAPQRSQPQRSQPQPQRSQPQAQNRGFNVNQSDYKKPANTANNPNRTNTNPNANKNTANNPNRTNTNNNANKNTANNPNRTNTNTNNNRTNVNNNNTNVNRNNTNINRNTTINNNTYIRNPVYYGGGSYGWNHGVAWAPAYGYYGGGFWGAFAIGVTSAAVYGAIVSANNVTYTSYQVQPSSPGATMLSNYQLTQTQCGPPNLVVIYGPNNSVICAFPNNLVSAGNYNLDTATLSLTNQ
jgi:hypothetical protein